LSQIRGKVCDVHKIQELLTEVAHRVGGTMYDGVLARAAQNEREILVMAREFKAKVNTYLTELGEFSQSMPAAPAVTTDSAQSSCVVSDAGSEDDDGNASSVLVDQSARNTFLSLPNTSSVLVDQSARDTFLSLPNARPRTMSMPISKSDADRGVF
jgi:hypothetical protein